MKQILAIIALFAAALVCAVAFADRVPAGTADDIRARTQPFGELCKAGDTCGQAAVATASGAARSGDAVYNQFCFVCHTAGVGGAPKLHDVNEWAPHLAKGDDVVWGSVMKGLNAMPVKGTCMNCTDDELHAAIDFMSKAQ